MDVNFLGVDGKSYTDDELVKVVFRRDNGKFIGVEVPNREVNYYTFAQMREQK